MRPSSVSRLASLPIVVVLPTPFTPTKSHTAGPGSPPEATTSLDRVRSNPDRRSTSSAFTSPGSSAASSTPSASTLALTASMISVEVVTPTSARMSASSRDSHVSSSIPPEKIPPKNPASDERAPDRRSRNDGRGPTSSIASTAVSETAAGSMSGTTSEMSTTSVRFGGSTVRPSLRPRRNTTNDALMMTMAAMAMMEANNMTAAAYRGTRQRPAASPGARTGKSMRRVSCCRPRPEG